MNTTKTLLAGIFPALVWAWAASAQPGQTGGSTTPAAQSAPGSQGTNAQVGTITNRTGTDSVKSQIHATDEEWKVISPVLQSVVTARQTAFYSLIGSQPNAGSLDMFGGGRGGRGGRGGGFGRRGPGNNDSFSDPGAGRGFGPGGGFGPGPDGDFGRGGPDAMAGGTGSTIAPGAGPNEPGPNGPPGGGPGGMGGANNEVAAAMVELKAAIANSKTTADQISEKVTAVHNARQKAKADLAVAEKNLRQLLTADQQAVLISLGYLE